MRFPLFALLFAPSTEGGPVGGSPLAGLRLDGLAPDTEPADGVTDPVDTGSDLESTVRHFTLDVAVTSREGSDLHSVKASGEALENGARAFAFTLDFEGSASVIDSFGTGFGLGYRAFRY